MSTRIQREDLYGERFGRWIAQSFSCVDAHIKPKTLFSRLDRGLPIERALTESPVVGL